MSLAAGISVFLFAFSCYVIFTAAKAEEQDKRDKMQHNDWS